jgi:hypothetical protein
MRTVELPAMAFDSGTPLTHSPINACSDSGFQLVYALALLRLLKISELNTLYLHFRYGRQFAIPLASHSLLPPCMQSFVLVCWLGFDQVGLSNLPTSAFVTHIQPFVQPNQKYRLDLSVFRLGVPYKFQVEKRESELKLLSDMNLYLSQFC